MSNSPKMKLFAYAACGTCKKAQKWLDAHGLAYELVPIVEQPPSVSELSTWITQSGLPAKKWFNTSGQSYRALIAELGKEQVEKLTEAQIVEKLSRDGKLIKRPVLVTQGKVLVGFREEAYADVTG